MDNSLLCVDDLSISYGEAPALNNVSFSIKSGEIAGIVGESGSGKTTLLKGIMSLLDKNANIKKGSVIFDGRDMLSLNAKERSRLAGKEVSMIFQNSEGSLDPTATVGSQLSECIRAHQRLDKNQAKQMGLEMLSKLDFGDVNQVWRAYPFELSGGMCQRVSIAMAMVNEPKLLLADEPTSALDVTIQSQVVKTLSSLRDRTDTAMLIVSHNMGVIAHTADYIGVMYKGRLVEWGKRDEVLFSPCHPYTKSLLSAIPDIDTPYKKTDLFNASSYCMSDERINYSDTHWFLEAVANE